MIFYVDFYLKQRLLIKSGYYLVHSPSTALPYNIFTYGNSSQTCHNSHFLKSFFYLFFLIVILPFRVFCSSRIGSVKNYCLFMELPHKNFWAHWNTSFCSMFGTSLTKISEDITMSIVGVLVDSTFILKFKKKRE